LSNKKAPGPDIIPNETLKICKKKIFLIIAELIKTCFETGYFFNIFRETTTIVFRKEGKKDYSLPGSYKSITLKNTLAKIIEKLVAYRIIKVFEKHNLFPRFQIRARKKRATLTALSFLIITVHSVWQKHPGYVASIFSLDLLEAFNKVSHEKLL